MNIPNTPHTSINLTEGESEAFEMFLAQRKKEAENRFTQHQAAMLSAASDVELCIILEKKLKGEPTSDRHQFKTNAEKLRMLQEQQASLSEQASLSDQED